MFQALGFEREIVNGIGRIETALAFVMGNLAEDAPLLRIHSLGFARRDAKKIGVKLIEVGKKAAAARRDRRWGTHSVCARQRRLC